MCDQLHVHRELLADYFGIRITEQGQLLSLPQLVQKYIPPLRRRPMFLLRLVTEVQFSMSCLYH